MPEIVWPQHRSCPFTKSAAPDLFEAWDWSRRRIEQLQEALKEIPSEVALVAVSGSLSRMEAHPQSDVDLLIVLDDKLDDKAVAPAEDAQRIHAFVWQQILKRSSGNVPLKAPRPNGIFSRCVSWKAMTDLSARGIVNEDMVCFGHRMQLLADAQPIIGQQQFCDLRRDILYWYRESRTTDIFQKDGPYHWLRHDVLRYWHSISARACWRHSDLPAEFLKGSLKVRTSRLAIITGLLTAINSAHAYDTNMESIAENLFRELIPTPMERLIRKANELRDGCSEALSRLSVIEAYNAVWKYLSMDEASTAVDLPREILESATLFGDVCRRIQNA